MSQDEKKLFSSEVLHKRLKIPRKYLQRLLTNLAKNGLIRSVRGRNGGYTFARNIKRIRLSEVIEAVEGSVSTPECFFGFEKCPVDNPCAMHELWSGTQHSLIKALSTTRLYDILKNS